MNLLDFLNAKRIAPVLLTLLLAGCGQSHAGPQLSTVSGNVLFDQAPVENGFITFKDPTGQEKSYATPIRNGAFQTKISPGKKSVEVTATRLIPGKKVVGPSGNQMPASESFIPKKYNKNTELSVDVPPSGKTDFVFELTGDLK